MAWAVPDDTRMLGGEQQGKEVFALKKGVQVKVKICSLLGDL